MANRDLLKEAIADAKAVKETAIANAKAALEEAFTPMLREKLAKKIEEMDEEVEEGKKEVDEMKKKEVEENYSVDEADYMEEDESVEEAKEKTDEVDLEELLRELEAMEEGDLYEEDSVEEGKMKKDDKKKDLKEETSEPHGNIGAQTPEGEPLGFLEEEDDAVTVSDDEEIDLENMSEDDLKSFIEDVIADMVSAGELEAGEGAEDAGENAGEEGGEEAGVEVTATEKEEVAEAKKKTEEMKKKMEGMKKELDEAYSALETIKAELNEVNLFNAKLLYTNKIFKAKNLTESQKVKVLAAFDKAASVKEAKLVFETLSEGFKEKKSAVNESLLRGSASKPAGMAERKPILEVNDQFARWQTLAGIKK